jgi:hypothetical protein
MSKQPKATLREEVEKQLRQQFEVGLDQQIDDCLDREREGAVERFIEEWEGHRGQELEWALTEKFEEDLDDAIKRELEKLETA